MRIAFLGDIALLGQFDRKKNPGVRNRLVYLKNLLAGYDIVIANLEAPFTKKEHTMVCKSMHLKSDPCNVELLKYLGITAVSLANNHIADYGTAGLNETLDVLGKAGIQWFGIQNKSLKLKIDNERLRISGFCCYSSNGTHYGKDGINLLTLENLQSQLQQDEEEQALSLVMLHWGMEHTNYPAYEHVCLMKKLLGRYKAVVCGHHPHIVQGVQGIENSVVAYSLGNALFDKCVSRNGKLTVELNEDNRKCFCLGVTVKNGEITGHEINGFYIGMNGIEKLDIGNQIRAISKKLEIDDIDKYEAMRKKQFQKVIRSKFGRHDIKWLISRLNYYAIGARLLGEIRNKKYRKEAEKFISG